MTTATDGSVWYRKYRPQRFADIAGQEQVTTILRRAVSSERVSHAYLFSGPRGSGKTTAARVLAMAANCTDRGTITGENAGEPCLGCASCTAIQNGGSPDLIEMDAASNRGIDDVRALRSAVGFTPSAGKYRIYILDEAHELTPAAFDALLKTIEEPPSHAVFILCTTAGERIPETVRSRCQQHMFERVGVDAMTKRLVQIAAAEQVTVAADALQALTRQANGSLRDAIGLLEQAALSANGNGIGLADLPWTATPRQTQALRRLTQFLLNHRLREALELIAQYSAAGYDARWLARETCEQLRRLLRVRAWLDARPSDRAAWGARMNWTADELTERETWARALTVKELGRWIETWATAASGRDDGWGTLSVELAVVKCLES